MAKRPPLDLSSTSTVEVDVAGIWVSVTVDANGWPISCVGGIPLWGDDHAREERLTKAAFDLVSLRAAQAAEARAKATADAERTKKSTETKQAQAAEHFSARWLAEAHESNTKLGAYRLAVAARRLLAAHPDDPNNEHRAEISEHRAKQFLKTRRNSGDM